MKELATLSLSVGRTPQWARSQAVQVQAGLPTQVSTSRALRDMRYSY